MSEDIDVPPDHPRYQSLLTRHRIEAGVEAGLTSKQGLIAEGRGEAFDYLLGEQTTDHADRAARVGAAHLLLAENPVLSVNGNVAALVPADCVALAEACDGALEVNLFNRSEPRMEAIAAHLREHGAAEVNGLTGDGSIPGLDHGRGIVDADGIEAADVVLVPLEDGDRAGALRAMGKTTIVVDLNPLSRSAQTASVPVIDNVIRALENVRSHVEELARMDAAALRSLVSGFDADEALGAAEDAIRAGELATAGQHSPNSS